jgi:hypothetical protein
VKLDLRVVGAALASGVVLIIVGLIVGRPTVGFSRAYFSGPPFHATFAQTGTGLLDPADGNLWIGAGIAACLAAGVVLARRGRAPAD